MLYELNCPVVKSILMLFALLGLKNMFFLIVLLEQRGHLSTLQQVAGVSDTVIGSFEGIVSDHSYLDSAP